MRARYQTAPSPVSNMVRVSRIELLSSVWKTDILTVVLYPRTVNVISELKAFRLVFSPCEVRLLIERARKNAKMEAFNQKFGVGYGN